MSPKCHNNSNNNNSSENNESNNKDSSSHGNTNYNSSFEKVIPAIHSVNLNPLHKVKEANILEEEQIGRSTTPTTTTTTTMFCKIP